MSTLICIDAGTTNTRVWLTRGEIVLAHARASVGVRDTARDGSPERLHNALRDLIAEVRAQSDAEPSAVIAAGMITSSLGLAEVPHLDAPAGLVEIARNIQTHSFPQITDLPVLLVPGVRTGPKPCDLETVAAADLMRGEETLCLGLVAADLAYPPCTVINLGSHWKIVGIDSEGRVAGSLTSMAGELIHAAQAQTILSSAVPQRRLETADRQWTKAGMREQRRSGLARALFCVRLLEQSGQGSPGQRLSFLIGAFVSAEVDSLIRNDVLNLDSPLILVGGGGICEAWLCALEDLSVPVILITDDLIESALIIGLHSLMVDINRRQ
ncbi:MAG: 2-dehydro-3-deoxygalactonokinase [Acidobacteriota bacterium]|nr:MAG: 2-dehydro-3-deoxygalactonokinase [Acidobacteriota bacterium]